MRSTLAATAISLLALALGSCDLFLGPGSITISFSAQAKAIAPPSSTDLAIVSYDVRVSKASDVVTKYGITGASYTVASLYSGTWSVLVTGKNAAGTAIANSSFEVVVEAGKDTAATADMVRIAGTGTLDLTVTWSVYDTYDSVVGTATAADGTATAVDLEIQTSRESAKCTVSLSAGEYTLALDLKKAGTKMESISETVSIYADFTSSATIDKTLQAPAVAYSYTAANPIIAVDVPSPTRSQTFNLSGMSGKSLYLVKVNTGASMVYNANSGMATLTREYEPYRAAPSVAVFTPAVTGPRRQDNPSVAAWRTVPTAKMRTDLAARRNLSGLAAPAASVVDYGSTGTPYTAGSSTKSFWVQNSSGTFVAVNATLRAIGQYCYVWVVDANYDAASSTATDNKISTAQAQTLAAKFDGSSGASWKDGIYKLVTNIFGLEVGGGAAGDGGRDGDKHISILLYDIDGDYSASQSGGVFGFFWSKDDYSQADIDAAGYSNIKTNYTEMFYLDSHLTDRYPDAMYSTLAHEFQHMIHYNQKAYAHPNSAQVLDSTWLDEMCAMVAEDLIAAKLGIGDLDAPWSRLHEFSYHYTESGVTDWLTGNEVLKSYASAYAFGAFLLRNYGGPALFSGLVQTDKIDDAAVTEALSASGYADQSFTSVLSAYGQSLVFTDKPAGSTVKTLKLPGSWSFGSDAITYKTKALDYAVIQQRDLTNGFVSGTYGPRVYSPSDQVILRPAGQLVISKTAWQDIAADSVTAVVYPPSDASVKLFLMVK
jgi:hypothetical protein